MQTLDRQRPRGITIISIILWVLGVLALILIILGIIAVTATTSHSTLSSVVLTGLVVGAILAIAHIVVGWGLWTLKRWAFWTTVIVEILNVANGLFTVFGSHDNKPLFSIILSVVILIYLFADHNVRTAFRT